MPKHRTPTVDILHNTQIGTRKHCLGGFVHTWVPKWWQFIWAINVMYNGKTIPGIDYMKSAVCHIFPLPAGYETFAGRFACYRLPTRAHTT